MVQVLFQNDESIIQYRTRVNGTLSEMEANFVDSNILIYGIEYTINTITATRYKTEIEVESPGNPITQAIFDVTLA